MKMSQSSRKPSGTGNWTKASDVLPAKPDAASSAVDPGAVSEDPLARSRNLRAELESLRGLAAVMESPLVDDAVRVAFRQNLARAEFDVASAEKEGQAEYDRRSIAVDTALKIAIGEKLLTATNLTWETFNIGAWGAYLHDNAEKLGILLSAPAATLHEAESRLGIDPSSNALPKAESALSLCQAGVSGNPRTRVTASSVDEDEDQENKILIADGEFMSEETLRQCSDAGLETLDQAAAFTSEELSDLGLSQGAIIQLDAMLRENGMSFKDEAGTSSASGEGE